MDVFCEKSLTNGLKSMHKSCILDQERIEFTEIVYGMKLLAMNSVMACQSRHPFFKFVQQQLNKYAGKAVRGKQVFGRNHIHTRHSSHTYLYVWSHFPRTEFVYRM